MADKALSVRPKIDIPDLERFGIEDFSEGYDKFSRLEKESFWQTLLVLGLELVVERDISALNYHKLFSMLHNAFPEINVDESVFAKTMPNFSSSASASAGREVNGSEKPASKSDSKPASTAPATQNVSVPEKKKAKEDSVNEASGDEIPGDEGGGPGGGPIRQSSSEGGKRTSQFSGLLG